MWNHSCFQFCPLADHRHCNAKRRDNNGHHSSSPGCFRCHHCSCVHIMLETSPLPYSRSIMKLLVLLDCDLRLHVCSLRCYEAGKSPRSSMAFSLTLHKSSNPYLLEKVEMPSILVFSKMEQNGLGFNSNLAITYQKELQKKQQDILDKAYQMAGRHFNILSSKEVSRILFKELKLSPAVTPNCPSTHRLLDLGTPSRNKRLPPELKTNKECLEKILHLHPLPKAILDWRKLSFSTTKVLMPLLRKYKHDNYFNMDRLYATSYIYTLTGRVNVHSPNLQFIPKDFNIDYVTQDDTNKDENLEEYHCTDEDISQFGVSLRNLFIPSKGNVLLSADYSQLELRILAHLSKDKKLINSLNSGEDVFKNIASNWMNISPDSVSNEQRQQAKKVLPNVVGEVLVQDKLHLLGNEQSCKTLTRKFPFIIIGVVRS
ncbi:DNA polymerase theta [Trichonephila clavipes]|nr:DNA polymerase theta [Trichonephila clavipes]